MVGKGGAFKREGVFVLLKTCLRVQITRHLAVVQSCNKCLLSMPETKIPNEMRNRTNKKSAKQTTIEIFRLVGLSHEGCHGL